MKTKSIAVQALTDRQRSILEEIQTRHRGRACAVTHDQLVEHLGIPKRRLREALRQLVDDHGIDIGSGPTGVYLCQDEEDYEAALRCLDNLIWPSLQRRRRLARKRQERQAQARSEQRGEGVQGNLFGGE